MRLLFILPILLTTNILAMEKSRPNNYQPKLLFIVNNSNTPHTILVFGVRTKKTLFLKTLQRHVEVPQHHTTKLLLNPNQEAEISGREGVMHSDPARPTETWIIESSSRLTATTA